MNTLTCDTAPLYSCLQSNNFCARQKILPTNITGCCSDSGNSNQIQFLLLMLPISGSLLDQIISIRIISNLTKFPHPQHPNVDREAITSN